jgi:SAM-dependent methyltransferase
MMYLWKPEMVAFMKDASEYNPFHFTYVERIANYIPASAHICDAGCGLGYLSLALSPYYRKVTGIDLAKPPLAVFRDHVSKREIENIQVLEADIFEHQPEIPYDAMVFCFFGSVLEALKIGKRQCSGTIVLIKRNWNKHRFSIEESAIVGHTHAGAQLQLESLGIAHHAEVFELEMGQPFKNLADAVDFFNVYDRAAADHRLTSEVIQSRLVETDSEQFPLYLPMKRQIGMLIIHTDDIPENLDCHI